MGDVATRAALSNMPLLPNAVEKAAGEPVSEARQRLIERVTQATLDGYGPEGQVNALLRGPDDLLAVLVEEGVLERGDVQAEGRWAWSEDSNVCYLRCSTEGNTR